MGKFNCSKAKNTHGRHQQDRRQMIIIRFTIVRKLYIYAVSKHHCTHSFQVMERSTTYCSGAVAGHHHSLVVKLSLSNYESTWRCNMKSITSPRGEKNWIHNVFRAILTLEEDLGHTVAHVNMLHRNNQTNQGSLWKKI
jgi:hypothetical protein